MTPTTTQVDLLIPTNAQVDLSIPVTAQVDRTDNSVADKLSARAGFSTILYAFSGVGTSLTMLA